MGYKQELYSRRDQLRERRSYLSQQKSRLQSDIQDKYAQLDSGHSMDRYQREAIKNEINGLKAEKDDLQRSINEINSELDSIYNQLKGF